MSNDNTNADIKVDTLTKDFVDDEDLYIHRHREKTIKSNIIDNTTTLSNERSKAHTMDNRVTKESTIEPTID